MIHVKEFCCGCTLRTGTLIILWSTLVLDCLRSLMYFGKVLYDPTYSYFGAGSLTLLTIFLDIIFLTACCFGIAVSTLGIYGIHQNRPELLNLCYYYYTGYVGYWIFIVIMIIIKPSSFYYVSIISPLHILSAKNVISPVIYLFVYAIGYFFLSAFTFYCTLIIRSCKENLINSREEGKDSEIPDQQP